jgi:hypothetical protein
MKAHLLRRTRAAAAWGVAVAIVVLAFVGAQGARSLVADKASADPSVPNPGHSYTQIELPSGTWSGLDADKVDGLDASQIMGRAVFSRTRLDTGSAGWYSSVIIGSDGLPLISYPQTFTGGGLNVAHCSDVACTAATITTLDSGTTVYNTSVTIVGDGLGLISYYDSTNYDLKVAHCSNVACTAATITRLDSTGDVGWYTSVTVDQSGYGLISYYDYTNRYMKVARCSSLSCTAATLTTIDTTIDSGRFNSITLTATGFPIISYYDRTNFDLKVAWCSNLSCSAYSTYTLDSTGDVGSYSSITTGSDGFPLISYYDATNTALKVAHCSNSTCSAHDTPVIIESANDVGQYTSITVGSDGMGLISYYYPTSGYLKVAHCSNLACSSATTVSADDTNSTDDGQYTSLTIGTDGLPLVSYYDSTNVDLKVAHCSDRFCAKYRRPR